MRGLLRLALFAGLVGGSLSASSITYDIINLNTVNGSNQPLYRYVYHLLGVSLQQNQALEISFEVARYAALSNGVPANPNANFDLLLFQPNSPPGSDGLYSLLAKINNPSMAGAFSVDVAMLPGIIPNTLNFAINQYGAGGTGSPTLVEAGTAQATPEPATLVLSLGALSALYLVRRRKQQAQS
jgi:hypothetical protein